MSFGQEDVGLASLRFEPTDRAGHLSCTVHLVRDCPDSMEHATVNVRIQTQPVLIDRFTTELQYLASHGDGLAQLEAVI